MDSTPDAVVEPATCLAGFTDRRGVAEACVAAGRDAAGDAVFFARIVWRFIEVDDEAASAEVSEESKAKGAQKAESMARRRAREVINSLILQFVTLSGAEPTYLAASRA
ncbi:hypothetical protein AA23498_2055 [Acetobacter nitrogenifigens DSM 23921 = NBRC 105050]|nr:hypothetical protein [Acetobacter nitrogenifigens]GBQ94526.1 hypothetical protein AA23498_2055 [Acetobacter nitrogenifigens DSM 23921 = NBRC 105050]